VPPSSELQAGAHVSDNISLVSADVRVLQLGVSRGCDAGPALSGICDNKSIIILYPLFFVNKSC
jgi:hypothetical protein